MKWRLMNSRNCTDTPLRAMPSYTGWNWNTLASTIHKWAPGLPNNGNCQRCFSWPFCIATPQNYLRRLRFSTTGDVVSLSSLVADIWVSPHTETAIDLVRENSQGRLSIQPEDWEKILEHIMTEFPKSQASFIQNWEALKRSPTFTAWRSNNSRQRPNHKQLKIQKPLSIFTTLL